MAFKATNSQQANIKWSAYQLSVDRKTEDFPTIVLTRKEQKLLKKSIKSEIKVTSDNQLSVNTLDLHNLVYRFEVKLKTGEIVDVIQIRARGLYYWRYLRREKQFGFISSFRYWVTTAIAAIALIISIVAVIWQAG